MPRLMVRLKIILPGLLWVLVSGVMAQNTNAGAEAGSPTLWLVNNTTNIGGHPVTVRGTPQVVATAEGGAVRFNGIDEGLMVSANPLAGLSHFTVEMIFKHAPLTAPKANAPRIVHIETPGGASVAHRFTLETRVAADTTPHTYFLDSFLRFGDAADFRLTLFNDKFRHPVGEWSHMAVTYDGTNFCNFVNGRLENCGPMKGQVFAAGGVTWIGQRANNVGYFEGEVRALRFTPRVLGTNEFLRVQP